MGASADVMEAFPGVTFAVHYSRYNMREKNGKPARQIPCAIPIDRYKRDFLQRYEEAGQRHLSILRYQALDAAFLLWDDLSEVEIAPAAD